MRNEISTLQLIRSEVIRINKLRIEALQKGDDVIFYELSNNIDKVGKKLTPLIALSTERIEKYKKLVDSFSAIDPVATQETTKNLNIEITLGQKLENLNADIELAIVNEDIDDFGNVT